MDKQPPKGLLAVLSEGSFSTPTNDQIFESWLARRSIDPFDPLSPEAARPYRSIWTSWCKHLAETTALSTSPEHLWLDAQAIDLQRFLFSGGIQPARTGRENVSEISRHRYWRVIRAVYDFAIDNHFLSTSPASGLSPIDTPSYERSSGQIFHNNDWQKIVEAIPTGDGRWDTRNRAILYLIMDAALTTAEVATLLTSQVKTHSRLVSLDLDGPRQAQQRNITVSAPTSKHVRDWIDVRSELDDPKKAPRGALFLTQKGHAIKTTGIYHLVTETIGRALSGSALLSHTGAQTLRNTRLVAWLNNGVPVHEVIRRAGFKDEKSFRGIREHIDPSVMPPLEPRHRQEPD
jgi:site-specific recombinase XerD